MESRENAEKFWDRTALFYDKAEQNDASYKIFIEAAKKYISANDTVLDFGCGTGIVCNEIANQVKSIYAIDISSKMIEISRAKSSERKIQNIEFAHTTLFNEKIKPGSFDAIIAFNIFHLLGEPQKSIQRINELLKPEGFIISLTPCLGESPLLNSLLKIGSKLRLIPRLKSFKISEFEQFFNDENFVQTESYRLKPNSPQYLFIAEKSDINSI
ncbi:MAG: class I SAM-dependent methyltransferase [Bacteroidota bacterium]